MLPPRESLDRRGRVLGRKLPTTREAVHTRHPSLQQHWKRSGEEREREWRGRVQSGRVGCVQLQEPRCRREWRRKARSGKRRACPKPDWDCPPHRLRRPTAEWRGDSHVATDINPLALPSHLRILQTNTRRATNLVDSGRSEY